MTNDAGLASLFQKVSYADLAHDGLCLERAAPKKYAESICRQAACIRVPCLPMKVILRSKPIRLRKPVGSILREFFETPQNAIASRRNLALAAAALLAPCALVAFTITCWSIAADLHWTSGFFLSRGFFSHWQGWLIASLVLLLLSRVLAQCRGETDSKYYK